MSRAHAQARLELPAGLIALPSSGFPQGCCGKVENSASSTVGQLEDWHTGWASCKIGTLVKRSDYITNSVRCQGTVIFLNKMKGESGRLVPVEKLASAVPFLCILRYNSSAELQLRNWHKQRLIFS